MPFLIVFSFSNFTTFETTSQSLTSSIEFFTTYFTNLFHHTNYTLIFVKKTHKNFFKFIRQNIKIEKIEKTKNGSCRIRTCVESIFNGS